MTLTHFGCKVGQSDPIVMTLQLYVSRCLLNVHTKFQIDISKHVQNSLENSSLTKSPAKFPLPSVFVRQKAKSCLTMMKINRGQDIHYIIVCTKSEGSIAFEAMNTENDSTYFGCKVG